MSEWQEVKLGELIDINQSSIGRNYEFENIRYYDISSIGIGVAEDPKNLSRSEAPSRAKRIIKDGDIILATVRPGNRSFYYFKQTRENDIASTGFAVISPRNNLIDNKFLYYLISAQSFTNYLVSNEQGATYPAITPSVINRAKINLPPLPTQQKIAKILSNYDDLIENNLKRIKLLEESARLTYEEWFLRFRIDGKKLEIDPETKLPFGWSNQLLNSICKKISSGGTPSRANEKYWNSDDYDWVATKELKDGYIYSTKEKISLLGLENSSAKLFPKSTVVMAIYASPTLGRLGILTKESCFNQAAVGFIVDENFISNEFLYCKLIDERVGLNALAIGAAQQNINVAKVKSYEVTIPDLELLQKFTKVTKPIFNEIENLGFQNQLLKEARDILLPRLMTNVIDTNDMDIAI